MSSDVVWQRYGESDPYYGVLTLDAYRKDNISANRRDFFASGEALVARVLDQVESGLGPVQCRHAVDFGAGVGRLSLPLARRFAKVSSVDVSPGMLRELASNAADQGIGNIASVSRVDEIEDPIDFALSLIVLQHIGVERGLEVIFALWDKLAPGGVLALDVPIASRQSRLRRAGVALRGRLPFTQTVLNLVRGRPAYHGVMQMNLYPLDRITDTLFARGAAAVTLLPSEPDPAFTGALIVCRKT